MQIMVRITTAILSLYMTVASAAQEDYVRIRMPNAPAPEEIMRVLAFDKNAQLFATILRTSELTQDDFASKYVTFLVPRDASCTAEDRDRMANLTTKEAARVYILDHAFDGDLGILRDFQHGSQRVLRAGYSFDRQSLQGVVTIDENHPLNVPLLGDKSVVVSLIDGTLHVGARSVVLDSFGVLHGAGIYLDHCAVF